MTPLAQRVLEIAASELAAGVHESPAGSNRGPRVDQYVKSRGSPLGVPWCAAFAAWCITTSAQQLGLPDPLAGWGDVMSAHKWFMAAHAHGCWVAEPQPGMVGVQTGDGPHGHVTIITDYGCGIVISHEGNHENRTAEVERPLLAYTGFVAWERAIHAPG